MKRGTLPLLAAALAACSTKAPTGPAAGKAYFVQAGCANCHSVAGEGGRTGPDLTLVGLRHSPEWLDVWIKDPKAWKPDAVMPNTRLSDAARGAIVSYLATLQGQDWPKGSRPWDGPRYADPVARGRLLFARAGCLACHGLGGAGGHPNNNVKGGVIPSLVKVSETYSKPELVAKIKNGVPHPLKADPNGPEPLVRMPTWGAFLDDAELDAVASYLLTLKPGTAEKPDW